MSVVLASTLMRLLLSVIELTSEAEGSDIGVCGRHGNRAEDTVPFASGDDPHIISLSFFQLRAAVLPDRGAGGSGTDVGGLIPVPGSARICRHKDIISIAPVDFCPVELHSGVS